MPDHRIRLARAWTQRLAERPPRRVDLPTCWTPADLRQPFELVRHFQWPRVDPTTQALDLELVDVPGLMLVRLDGSRLLDAPLARSGPTRIALDRGLPGRRQLVLTVDPAEVEPGLSWGIIALVIRDRSV